MSEESCQVCKRNKYLEPNLILLVSSCFHRMCEACVARIYNHGNAPCPICKSSLKKADFIKPSFDDVFVEKEVQIRKRYSRIFNKRKEDFPSLKEFNDYLESIEDVIFNLVNNVDLEETHKFIERFKQTSKEMIEHNNIKLQQENRMIQRRLEMEAEEKQMLEEAYKHDQLEEHKQKINEKNEMIDTLMNKNTRREKRKGDTDLFQTTLQKYRAMADEFEDVLSDDEQELDRDTFVEVRKVQILETCNDPLYSFSQQECLRMAAGGFTMPLAYSYALSLIN